MITIYFKHETLTPHNVREVWHDALAVPRVGDVVSLGCGYEGASVTWTVLKVTWLNGQAVECLMTGAKQ